MKRAYLATLTITLLTATSVYALDCATPPTCAELGYTDTVANCSGDSIKCPFDTSVGKCLSAGAVVGQIAYFAKDPGEGWLLCDGKIYSKSKYPELHALLNTTTNSEVFAVPNYVYSGAFLRPASYTSYELKKGCAPNIYGHFGMNTKTSADEILFSKVTMASNFEGIGNGDYTKNAIRFNASKYNPIYSDSCGAPTPNYFDVATYIYAGKKVSNSSASASLSSCAVGYYYYKDGGCSSSYYAARGMKGIVTSVNTSTPSVTYIFGGGGLHYASSYYQAVNICKASAPSGNIADFYQFQKLPTSISGSATVAVSTSKTYWYMGTYTSSCTSQTSCTSNGANSAVPGTSYYFYCTGTDVFDKN